MVCFCSVSFAQQFMKGKIASIGAGERTVSIFVKSVSAEGPPEPTEFAVTNKSVLNALLPGDQVRFTSTKMNGTQTISSIAKY